MSTCLNEYAPPKVRTSLGSSVTPSLNGEVHALSLLVGWLYAGGTFTEVQYGQIGTPYAKHLRVEHIARYRDGTWQTVGSGVGGPVYALAAIRGCIYVGGIFDRVCDSKELVRSRALRCKEESDPENFQRANSIARMCYGNGTGLVTLNSEVRWESVTSHGQQALGQLAKVRALASFDNPL